MSASRSSGGGDPMSSPSFPLTPNEIAARMSGLRIGVLPGPSPMSMPEPKIWKPPMTTSDGKPLPALPPLPPMPSLFGSPPHPRSPHTAHRLNPYELSTAPQPPRPTPPCLPPLEPIPMPLPNPWDERPPMSPHAHSDPPPSLRPGFSPSSTPSKPPPKIPPPHNGYLFIQHAPPKKPDVLKPPRSSGPPAPDLIDSRLAPPYPTRARASSVPLSPTTSRQSDGAVQCSGLTKAGELCSRLVKSPHPFILATPAKDGDIERFCHQHVKKLLLPSGVYSRTKESKWIEFDDWIPSYLSSETKAALRAEMDKPPSTKDVPGYIYCYEIRDPKTPNQVHLKVGRAVKLVKRLDEWAKRCGSKEVVLRGWWPGAVIDDDGAGPSLLRGRIQAGEKGKYCHRLERLIHLELSDLMINEAYLTPEFSGSPGGSKKPSTTSSPAKPSAAKKTARKACADCGTVHREIFTFTRVLKGALKGREWDGVVEPVIERWGRFVEEML